jgi:colanic acid/amylovoran biosynthesis glycosyltransferase
VGTCFLAMSNDMRDDLVSLGCPPEKIRVHYHGINLQRFPRLVRPAAPETVRVLFVGSLGDERKGVEDVIRAFAQAAHDRPHLELRLVGTGRLQDRFAALARELGVAGRVAFAGYVQHPELWREYQAAQIFCHPSVTPPDGDKEGIPGTIVEAMATGLPVVTTRHAGIPEMALDGEHGFVVAEHDVAALARGIGRLADDPELRTRLGGQAAERAAACGDAVRQTAALEAIYDDVLAAHRREQGR